MNDLKSRINYRYATNIYLVIFIQVCLTLYELFYFAIKTSGFRNIAADSSSLYSI